MVLLQLAQLTFAHLVARIDLVALMLVDFSDGSEFGQCASLVKIYRVLAVRSLDVRLIGRL
jgi:hypothetical protein